ncbi:MAG: DNA repair protein RecN [Planctomycetes bacterium]|nr:DNA repair protein RecN [Planctomycetota bacterium]
MLRELRVRNLALLDDVRVAYGEGFHVVTGATGSGKSLLLAALDLLLGGRFSKELLRTGADDVRVEGLFEIADAATRRVVSELLGASSDDDVDDPTYEIVLRRRVDANGRNRCEVNGSLVPVSTLRALGRLLVEIHGQSEHQALLESSVQTHLLDRAAGLVERRDAFAAKLAEWHAAAARLADLTGNAAARRARLESIEQVIHEIREAKLHSGEQDELRRERTLLGDATRHAEALAAAIALIDGERDSAGAVDQLGRAARAIEATSSLDPRVKDALESLETAASAASDAVRTLSDAADRIESNPARLEEVDERIASIGHVLRRHGPTEADAVRTLAEAEAEATGLRCSDGDSSALSAKCAALEQETLDSGRALDDARRKAGKRFAEAVKTSLADLGMPGTRFEVSVGAEAHASNATALGLSKVEFLVSPNPGEDLRPMARIASGGELARIALSIRGELAGRDGVPLLVFDEIDADVGPRLGAVIGERLRRLAHPKDGPRQVLAVTHLSQVAEAADHHLRVSKRTDDGRTVSSVEVVTGPERERELTEMRGEKRAPGKQRDA